MGRVLLCLAIGVAVVGCQPLYGSKPEKLHTPEKKKKPPEPPESADQVKYIDDCTASFQDDPKKAHPQPMIARPLVEGGDAAIQNSEKAPEANAKVGLIREAIDKYRNALVKDPYNVTATLELAVAYDKLLRKGCAIAMLKRLASLSNNPKWANEANRNIDSIDANGQWFKGYRKDALAAVGR
jgi:predicted Zn-dependent protease